MGAIHLVTGATDGIGLETARQLQQWGATVLVHGRSEQKALAAAAKVNGSVGVWGDLSDLAQVRSLAQQVWTLLAGKPLDVIVNNAGVFANERQVSKQGHELTFAVNHLAPFLLTQLLLDAVKAAPQGRIVNVSSMAHARGALNFSDLDHTKSYDGYAAYADSKLANILHARGLAKRLTGTKVTTYALHPGVITTKLLKAGFSMTGASVESGARTSVYCATNPELASVSGRYYSDSREARPSKEASDDSAIERLWLVSEQRVQPFSKPL
jgi:NAD(P)-dependent dehydrogenase (short-subunit alcohol dehydrogenase family)